MNVWSGEEVADYISPIEDFQIQPNGVDLRVGNILVNSGRGVLGEENRTIPERSEHNSKLCRVYNGNGLQEYKLRRGSYIVVYKEKLRIPENAIGLVYPRSSLMRMGARLHSAVWDSGYEGQGEGLLIVHNHYGIDIMPKTRIGQMIFIDSDSYGEYEGKYQGERVS